MSRKGPRDGRSYKGLFVPTNPSKYVGDVTKIVYRSSWELKLMQHLDTNINVVKWASEEVVIQYYNPVDSKYHRYFVDFYIKMIDRNGSEIIKLVEVKPHAQTLPPKKPQRITQAYKRQLITYHTNQAKWKAARLFAEERNMKFEVFTEYQLGIK